MPELLEESSQLESTTVGVFRTAETVKGGRRFSFNSLVVIGNRRGQIGWGYGKANEVPPAIEKAQKAAKRNMFDISLHGGTIPHEVIGAFGSARVKLMPASPGTGIVAGATVRAVLELLGITDCLTKCQGLQQQDQRRQGVLRWPRTTSQPRSRRGTARRRDRQHHR